MDFEKFKKQIEQADNDGLIRSLVEHAKKMDTDIAYYEAVKIIKGELLDRLEGKWIEEKEWRNELTEQEKVQAVALYKQGVAINKIPSALGDDNLAVKPIRLLIADKFGVLIDCERCGLIEHVAYTIGEHVACVQCGRVQQ